MPVYVHIADARDAASIRRSGLRLPKRRLRVLGGPGYVHGVFALPVLANFLVSHQWLRELKASGFRTAVGVYFRIPDDEPVWASRFGQDKQAMTAAEAAGILRVSEELGFEVVIPRSVRATEIDAVRALPQNLGWRYFPESKGRPPFCGCRYCQRGRIKSGKLRRRFEASM